MRPDGLRRLQAVLAPRQVKVQQAHVRPLFGDRFHAFLWRRRRRQHLVSPRLKGDSEGFNQNPLIVAEYKAQVADGAIPFGCDDRLCCFWARLERVAERAPDHSDFFPLSGARRISCASSPVKPKRQAKPA
jgi:hypothetical protein